MTPQEILRIHWEANFIKDFMVHADLHRLKQPNVTWDYGSFYKRILVAALLLEIKTLVPRKRSGWLTLCNKVISKCERVAREKEWVVSQRKSAHHGGSWL